MTEDQKTCTNPTCEKNGEPQSLDAFRTKKLRDGTTAPTSWCRSCLNALSRRSMAAKAHLPERVEARRVRGQARYARIKADPALLEAERKRKREAARRPENAARRRETVRAWSAANPDRVRKNRAEWRAANREKTAAYTEKWRTENRQTYLDQKVLRSYERRWRMVNQGSGKFTNLQALICRAFWGGRCAYCGNEIVWMTKTSSARGFDHVFPIVLGGGNGPENVVACCRTCNTKKNKRVLSDERFEKIEAQIIVFFEGLPPEAGWNKRGVVPFDVLRVVFAAEERLRGQGVTVGTEW